jgi:putative phosphoesterase
MKLLILSDIHSNWTALRSVLEAEPDAEQLLCLGDLVDYGPQPIECVEWAMQKAQTSWFLQGNHDRGVAYNEDPRCSPPYRSLTRVTQEFCMKILSEPMRAFLGKLEPMRSLEVGGSKCFACHAAPSDPLYLYLRANNPARMERELEIAGNPDFLFFGHTHWPMNRHIGKTQVVNPGSIGQPKDGDPCAAYAVWQDGEVTLRRALYDIEETVRAYATTPLQVTDVAALVEVLRTAGNLPE